MVLYLPPEENQKQEFLEVRKRKKEKERGTCGAKMVIRTLPNRARQKQISKSVQCVTDFDLRLPLW